MRRAFRLPIRSGSDIRKTVDEELAFHLEAAEEEWVQAGCSREEARARVRADAAMPGHGVTGARACGTRGRRGMGPISRSPCVPAGVPVSAPYSRSLAVRYARDPLPREGREPRTC